MIHRTCPSAPQLFLWVILANVFLGSKVCADDDELPICEEPKSSLSGGNAGLVLPLFAGEHNWSTTLRAGLYLLGLLWAFLGVGIVSDKFMMAIEVITSKERMVTLPDGATVSVRVWNATVANLTLMALGSSAPEILLSVIEIVAASFFSGKLGPSTIVGSAAFNLLMILAVCVVALPEGESRKVDDLGVYAVTASFSLFAYLWLLVILLGVSPDVVEPWEGILTFLFFPLLVFLAYGADRSWFTSSSVMPHHHQYIIGVNGSRALHAFECAEMLKNVNTKEINPEQTADIMAQMANAQLKPSRAQLRMNAIRQITGGKRVISSAKKEFPELAKAEVAPPLNDSQEVGFQAYDYAFFESDGEAKLTVVRSEPKGAVTVFWETVGDSATGGTDYEEKTDKVTFQEGETEKMISVKIFDDDEVEDDEAFRVRLVRVECEEGITAKLRHEDEQARVTIIDDDEPGELGFKPEHTAFTVVESQNTLEVPISRTNGSKGTIGCQVQIVEDSAVSGQHFTPLDVSETSLTFQPHEITKMLRIRIHDEKHYEKKLRFKIQLSDPYGMRASMSKYTESIVTIVADEEMKQLVDTVTRLTNARLKKYMVGTSSWAEQFREVFIVGAEDDDFKASTLDYAMHGITLPWKLLFAFIPPTEFGGGWWCFGTALFFIGVVTALIGDLASIFGCLIGLRDPVTAITLVALGTSLPDTFASKAAAISDENADASIGNVTGSNSVNVFLGLGMPWTLASIYWAITGPNKAWKDAFPEKDFKYLNEHHQGAFVVQAGSLGVSVSVFSACALICIGILYYRRVTYGAELGGPQGPARVTCAIFASLWLIYISVSTAVEYSQPE